MPKPDKYTLGNVEVTRGAATLALTPDQAFTDHLDVVICGVNPVTYGRLLTIGYVHQTSDGRWKATLTGPAPAGSLCVKGTYGSLRDALASMQEDADYYLARTGQGDGS